MNHTKKNKMAPSPKTEQIMILTSFMKRHSELAKTLFPTAKYKKMFDFLWGDLAKKLNAVGPPIKTVPQWKRAWTLRKYRLKKKLMGNKGNVESGDKGSVSEGFSANEKELISAIGLDKAVGHVVSERTQSPSSENTYEDIKNEIIKEEFEETRFDTFQPAEELLDQPPQQNGNFHMEGTSARDGIVNALNGFRNEVEKQTRLQEQQLRLQSEFQENALAILGSLHDDFKSHLEESYRVNREMMELKKTEIELKRLELELLKAKNDLKPPVVVEK